MKIYLIRHGMTEGNRHGRYIGTTDEALLEAERESLKNRVYPPAEAVFVSLLLRCRQTAGVIYPGQPVHILEELAECSFGSFENKNWKELSGNPDYQAWIDSNGTLPFPGGEDPIKFRDRCARGFERAVSECFREHISTAAFVVHGGTIMSILERYVLPKKDFYAWQAENGGGYEAVLEPSLWTPSRREIHCVRPLRIN